MGLCIGWNRAEFEALGSDFHTRGKRIEQQVELMRRLWSENSIDYQSTTESLRAVELNPQPLQQPIPVLLGGLSVRAVERAARIGDGWLPMGLFDDEKKDRLDYYRQQSERNAADPKVIGMINPWIYSYDGYMRQYEGWTANGATHIAIGTLPDCYQNSDQYFGKIATVTAHLKGER